MNCWDPCTHIFHLVWDLLASNVFWEGSFRLAGYIFAIAKMYPVISVWKAVAKIYHLQKCILLLKDPSQKTLEAKRSHTSWKMWVHGSQLFLILEELLLLGKFLQILNRVIKSLKINPRQTFLRQKQIRAWTDIDILTYYQCTWRVILYLSKLLVFPFFQQLWFLF